MVRNKPSAPTIATPPAPTNMASTSSNAVRQLFGNDSYTKNLMNRVATGQATDFERLEFEQYVKEKHSQPALATAESAPVVSTASEVEQETSLQLRLLQQQNMRRLAAAREQQESARDQSPLRHVYGHMPPLANNDSASQTSDAPQKSKGKKKADIKAQKEAKDLTKQLRQMLADPTYPFATEALASLHLGDESGKENSDKSASAVVTGEKVQKPKKGKKAGASEKKAEDDTATPRATRSAASAYTEPFVKFMRENPTVFHAVESQKKQLLELGWTELDERDKWDIVPGGRYFVERNGSSMLAFSVGEKYKGGNGCAIIAGHVDALTAKLKPISEVPNRAGFVQLGVAPYADAMNNTWWDRDLGIGGRVLVKEGDKIVTRLVKLDWPIARIPTLAPHFGAVANPPFNKETQMVPIIGLETTEATASDIQSAQPFSQPSVLGSEKGPVGSFLSKQPPALAKAISDALGLNSAKQGEIVGWELELYDVQPATVGGLNKDFIYAGRLDDKLCSWAAMQALISGHQWNDAKFSSIIKVVGWFDDEEIGSGLRQGAKSNFLPQTIERAVGCLTSGKSGPNMMGRTYANSFIVSSDVTHAVNPNFLNVYLENHAPQLNVGVAVSADASGHMTTDAVSTAIFQRCAESVGAKLQVFHARNDTREGGTIGPMLSWATGIRAIDAGIAQLSMHSIRATTGSLDPGLGVITFMGFLNRFEHVDKEFRK